MKMPQGNENAPGYVLAQASLRYGVRGAPMGMRLWESSLFKEGAYLGIHLVHLQ